MESNHELEDDSRPEYDFSKMQGGVSAIVDLVGCVNEM